MDLKPELLRGIYAYGWVFFFEGDQKGLLSEWGTLS